MLSRFPAFFLILVLAVGWAGQAARAEVTPAEAENFISGLADQAIRALATEDISRSERIKRFRTLLHQHFDVDTIGAWVLGRYWRTATKEEREEYLKLFERLIVATYVDRFSTYSGETLAVNDAIPSGSRDMTVKSRINRPAGQPVSVDWRVREFDGSLRIVDVIVEGISMGQTQRSEFGSVISRHDGKVSGLIEELRKIDLPE